MLVKILGASIISEHLLHLNEVSDMHVLIQGRPIYTFTIIALVAIGWMLKGEVL